MASDSSSRAALSPAKQLAGFIDKFDPAHAKPINGVFTPSIADLARARRIVAAFEKARAMGKDRAKVDGALVEVPVYAAAKRLLASAGRTPPLPQKKPR